MARLDYALLAEFARVDANGLITIVGGSFDRVQASGPNAAQQLYVALRVLFDEAEDSATVEVRIVPPDGEFALAMSTEARRNPAAQPLDGVFNVMIAVGALAILRSSGRYVVQVLIDGVVARELPIVVELQQPVGE